MRKAIAIDALAGGGLLLVDAGIAHFSPAGAVIALGTCLVAVAVALARRG